MHLFYRITISVGLVACGGAQKRGPGPEANVATDAKESAAVVPPTGAGPVGPSVLLGWYCPASAAGRPAVEPALARDPAWTNSQEFLARAIGAREVKRFSVLSYEGGRSGHFSVAGAATVGGASVAIGSYLGAQPCETIDGLGQVRSRNEQCVETTHGCALAVGRLEATGGFDARPYEEDPESDELASGAACEVGDQLLVDVDGDGAPERFSISELVAGRDPVELPLVPGGSGACEFSFAAPVVAGASLIRVGVLDLDGDGRPEVVYRRSDDLFVFGAPNSPARMELLGRATLTSAPK